MPRPSSTSRGKYKAIDPYNPILWARATPEQKLHLTLLQILHQQRQEDQELRVACAAAFPAAHTKGSKLISPTPYYGHHHCDRHRHHHHQPYGQDEYCCEYGGTIPTCQCCGGQILWSEQEQQVQERQREWESYNQAQTQNRSGGGGWAGGPNPGRSEAGTQTFYSVLRSST